MGPFRAPSRRSDTPPGGRRPAGPMPDVRQHDSGINAVERYRRTEADGLADRGRQLRPGRIGGPLLRNLSGAPSTGAPAVAASYQGWKKTALQPFDHLQYSDDAVYGGATPAWTEIGGYDIAGDKVIEGKDGFDEPAVAAGVTLQWDTLVRAASDFDAENYPDRLLRRRPPGGANRSVRHPAAARIGGDRDCSAGTEISADVARGPRPGGRDWRDQAAPTR